MKFNTFLPKHPAKRVTRWGKIKRDAREMLEMVRDGNFRGEWSEALALSHAQVSDNPYSFFVVHPEGIEKDVASAKLSSPFVVNAKILSSEGTMMMLEGCMSFPFRKGKKIKRAWKVDVEFQSPWIFGIMRKYKRTLVGLPAAMFQHEIEHAQGRNIFGI